VSPCRSSSREAFSFRNGTTACPRKASKRRREEALILPFPGGFARLRRKAPAGAKERQRGKGLLYKQRRFVSGRILYAAADIMVLNKKIFRPRKIHLHYSLFIIHYSLI
jgi:hypothetical protein